MCGKREESWAQGMGRASTAHSKWECRAPSLGQGLPRPPSLKASCPEGGELRVGNLSRGRQELLQPGGVEGGRPRELRELKPQQLRTKFILNHTPRSSQLIAELETIRELPNYCQLERANQAPLPHPARRSPLNVKLH